MASFTARLNKFFGKHTVELNAASAALAVIAAALPLQKSDRAIVTNGINALANGAANIAASLDAAKLVAETDPQEAVAVVREDVQAIVDAAVKAALEEANRRFEERLAAERAAASEALAATVDAAVKSAVAALPKPE